MATPQAAVSDVTIDAYGYNEWENALELTPEIQLAESKGNIQPWDGGEQLTWPIVAGNYPVVSPGGYADVSDLYVDQKTDTTASLAWGEMAVFVGTSKQSMRKNRGNAALIERAKRRIPHILRNLVSQGEGSIAWTLLNASRAADADKVYGLGDVFKFDTGAGTADEATVTASSTYAGLSLEVDGLTGIDNADSYAWTPRGFNTTSSGLTTSNFATIMNRAQTALTKGSGMDEEPDCVFHDRTHFEVGRNYMGASEQIFIKQGDKGGNSQGRGTSPKQYYFGGLEHYWSSNMPASTSYMLNFSQITLNYLTPVGPISMDKNPGATEGDKSKDEVKKSWFEIEFTYNDSRRGFNASVTAPFQWAINPRFQGIIKDFS